EANTLWQPDLANGELPIESIGTYTVHPWYGDVYMMAKDQGGRWMMLIYRLDDGSMRKDFSQSSSFNREMRLSAETAKQWVSIEVPNSNEPARNARGGPVWP